MNEREEFMKKFGDENAPILKMDEEVAPYRATGNNMNAQLDDPRMHVNDFTSNNINAENTVDNTMGMNVKPEVVTPEIPKEIPKPTPPPQPLPPIDDSNLDVTERLYEEQPIYDMQTNQTTTYIANNVRPKERKFKLGIDKETQVVLLMVLAIFIFILILPTISNFFNKLGR